MSGALLKIKGKACCCDETECVYYFVPCVECEIETLGNVGVPCRFFPEEPDLDSVYEIDGECYQYSPVPVEIDILFKGEPDDIHGSCIECCPPPPLGACCVDPREGDCQDDLTSVECGILGGTWFENQMCVDLGDACEPSSTSCDDAIGVCPPLITVSMPGVAVNSPDGGSCVCGAPPCDVVMRLVNASPPYYEVDNGPLSELCAGAFLLQCPCCFIDDGGDVNFGNAGINDGQTELFCVVAPTGLEECPTGEYPYWQLRTRYERDQANLSIYYYRIEQLCPVGAFTECVIDENTNSCGGTTALGPVVISAIP